MTGAGSKPCTCSSERGVLPGHERGDTVWADGAAADFVRLRKWNFARTRNASPNEPRRGVRVSVGDNLVIQGPRRNGCEEPVLPPIIKMQVADFKVLERRFSRVTVPREHYTPSLLGDQYAVRRRPSSAHGSAAGGSAWRCRGTRCLMASRSTGSWLQSPARRRRTVSR